MKVLKQNNNLIYTQWDYKHEVKTLKKQAPHLEGGEENKRDQKKRIK